MVDNRNQIAISIIYSEACEASLISCSLLGYRLFGVLR